ncbi:MAG TPA: diguanylate cyclase, partial [Pseudomonadaceae bacterium]|nr:diguanylate cyclase [Pseudomonadaceae bacterium]
MANSTLLLAMLQNAVILLVLMLVYVISSRPFADELQGTASRKRAWRLVSGLMMGGMGILIVSTPLNYSDSIIFDTRSVLISLAALYFGWLPTLIAGVITALYRLWLGGAVLTGILSIISSGIIGLLWRHRCKHRLDSLGSVELLAMGLCVHVVLVALMFTLPGGGSWQVIVDIILPVVIGFSLLTLLLGKLLSHSLHAEQLLRATRANAQRLSLAMAVSGQDLFELDLQSGEIHSISTTESPEMYPDRHLLDNIDALLGQLHPEDAPLIKELLQAVREGRLEDWEGDFRQYINADEWVWIHVAGRLVSRDEKGKPLTFLGTYLDVTARKLADERLWKQANIDKVTGLPNRSMFLEKLDSEVARASKNRSQLALIYLDIDHFKEVNDSLGHEAGDLLLQQLATRLRGLVQELGLDLVARIGGDEFTIILTELEDIGLAGDTARAALETIAEVFSIGGQQVHVGASAGITIYPEDGSSGEILLKNADQAMYKAKNEGRNCYYFFTPAMQEAVNRKARILSELREALQSSALQVYYQPVVDLASGAMVKVEALVRWQHPEYGMVPPDTFIPAAEESGL